MKRYQLLEVIGNSVGASNKARADVNKIATSLGFETVSVHSPKDSTVLLMKVIGKALFEYELIRAIRDIEKNSVLLVQVPFLNLANATHKNIIKYCKKRNIKLIAIIHDVNELRGTNADNKPFYELLNSSLAIISHNEFMTSYLVEKGINRDKIVNLEVFDYLLEKPKTVGSYAKQVTIGGNLDVEKVKYLKNIDKVRGCKILLYGPSYSSDSRANHIEYKGVVPASELPYRLNDGFGLVWDGDSIETCEGLFGNYLRYNNPHKLSMYIASGLPVIIWKQAAEAKFVQENAIGVAVESLLDLEAFFNDLTEEQYAMYAENVRVVREKVISGQYAKKAIEQSLKLV